MEFRISRRIFLEAGGLTALGWAGGKLGLPLEVPRFWQEVSAAEPSWYFPQTGFAVRADFFREFQRFGGLSNLGYPISRVFEKDGFPHQAFQRAILQWRKESNEAVPVNIMDELHKMGADEWLYSLGVPKHRVEDASAETRLSWLTYPEIKRAYFVNPDPLVFYGLPTSFPERFGPFLTQRFQRGALQLWLDEVSGMPSPGMVVGVLVGELAKETGFIPRQALEKEESLGPGEIPLPAVIRQGDRSKPLVALTFDDPWSSEAVARVLAIARQSQAKITFFTIGRVMAGQGGIWRQAVEEGHEIGNHTFTHRVLTPLSDQEIISDIQAGQQVLNQALGFSYPLRLLRPPGGAWDARLLNIAQGLGYSLALWSLDSGGTNRINFPYTDPRPIIAQVLPRVQNGEIILFHFNGNDVGALSTIIETIKQKGLQSVTISGLFS